MACVNACICFRVRNVHQVSRRALESDKSGRVCICVCVLRVCVCVCVEGKKTVQQVLYSCVLVFKDLLFTWKKTRIRFRQFTHCIQKSYHYELNNDMIWINDDWHEKVTQQSLNTFLLSLCPIFHKLSAVWLELYNMNSGDPYIIFDGTSVCNFKLVSGLQATQRASHWMPHTWPSSWPP